MKRAYIIDIDGTIAKKAPDRDIHDFSRVGEDTLYEDVANILYMIQEYYSIHYTGEYFREERVPLIQMIYVTARNETCREQTESWLLHNNFRVDELYMRGKYNQRKDVEVKKNIYWQHIHNKYEIMGVFEDRNNIVDMYRELGLTVYQVRENPITEW